MTIKYIVRSTGNIEVETPPAETMLKFLYTNQLGKKLLLPLVKRRFISEFYGRQMDKPFSVERIRKFVYDLNIDMSESKKSIEEFTSFNDFFYRELKPEARPIGKHFISPGDGKLLAFENINDVHEFYVKGKKFTLEAFLKNKTLARQYSEASMIILRLAPNDYHRYHFPYYGIPSSSKLINGYYYSVSPHALWHNFTEVFVENKREICRFELSNEEEMLIIPVGATMVGSIHSSYSPDAPVLKGDEMGYFSFGGSTVVLLINSTRFSIDRDLLQNTKKGLETFVKMGEDIGQFES